MAELAVMAIGATVAGAGISAIGAINQGDAANAAAKYNANAMEQDARRANEEAAARAGEVARRTRQVLASSRAGAGANGFDLDGSVDDLLGQAERQGNLDALTAIYEGGVRAQELRNKAKLTRFEGKQAQRAGYTAALGSVFSG
ncbi:MAG: hypothetical protein INF12_00015, partial [Methylobacterium sp.]|nr:hypothetical protein [Methylobacterium sp.]